MLLLLFKQILIWVTPVSTWAACRHQGHQEFSWTSDEMPVPGGSVLNPSWSPCPGTFSQLLWDCQGPQPRPWWPGSGPGELCIPCWASCSSFQVLVSWPSPSGWETQTPIQWKSSSWAETIAWLRALYHPHLESDAGWAATPSGWHTQSCLYPFFCLGSAWAGSLCRPMAQLLWRKINTFQTSPEEDQHLSRLWYNIR